MSNLSNNSKLGFSATSLNQEDEGDDMSIGMEAQTYASYES